MEVSLPIAIKLKPNSFHQLLSPNTYYHQAKSYLFSLWRSRLFCVICHFSLRKSCGARCSGEGWEPHMAQEERPAPKDSPAETSLRRLPTPQPYHMFQNCAALGLALSPAPFPPRMLVFRFSLILALFSWIKFSSFTEHAGVIFHNRYLGDHYSNKMI